MVDLSDQPCLVTFKLQQLLDAHRKHEAVRLAQEQLRAGYASPSFLAAVAALLEPLPAKQRGRPKSVLLFGHDAAEHFRQLVEEQGWPRQKAREEVARVFRIPGGERTIRRRLKEFEDALDWT